MKIKMFILVIWLLFAQFAFAAQSGMNDPSIISTVSTSVSLKNASSSIIVLDFEGAVNMSPIGNFYNGGSGDNYGVTFSANALAIVDDDAGGSGNFANEPSPSTVMFFMSGVSATMNVAAGFNTGFSFYYTSRMPGSVVLYDGLDGTGNILAIYNFSGNVTDPPSCTGDPNGAFCHWDVVGIPFSGTARSVVFSGVQDQCGFDDVTFGSITPGDIPTLNEWGMIIFSLFMAGSAFWFIRKESLYNS